MITTAQYVSCLVLTQDNRILLQQRGQDWLRFPGFLSAFGGKIEHGELPLETLIRELEEELGAKVTNAIALGQFTEEATNHQELVHAYFWHDENNTITGCYEGEAKYFKTSADVLKHPKIMEDVHWLLRECLNQGLIV